jgi:hypothetical protein
VSRPVPELRSFQTRLRLTVASVVRWRHLVTYNEVSYPVVNKNAVSNNPNLFQTIVCVPHAACLGPKGLYTKI